MRIRVLVIAAALIGSGSLATTPASAREVCAGTGVLNTPAMQYIIIGTPNAGPINGSVGLCSGSSSALVEGNLVGGCLLSNGAVRVNGNGPSDFLQVGSIVIIGAVFGNVIGAGSMIPAIGQSCLPPASATQFLATFALVIV
jgi:hypothetical protein